MHAWLLVEENTVGGQAAAAATGQAEGKGRRRDQHQHQDQGRFIINMIFGDLDNEADRAAAEVADGENSSINAEGRVSGGDGVPASASPAESVRASTGFRCWQQCLAAIGPRADRSASHTPAEDSLEHEFAHIGSAVVEYEEVAGAEVWRGAAKEQRVAGEEVYRQLRRLTRVSDHGLDAWDGK